jgi:alpha-L-arabinofuranosidase
MMKNRKATITAVLAAGTMLCSSVSAESAATLTADFTAKRTLISKSLYGIFLEDINYSEDGGLYAEMVQNRSFEFKLGTDQWKAAGLAGASKSRPKLKKEGGLNENNPHFAEIKEAEAGCGIANKGYNGMVFTAGKSYDGSVYLRSPDGSVTSVTAAIDEGNSKTQLGTAKITGITKEWKKFTYTITPSRNSLKGRLGLYADQAGTTDYDMVSLFPAETYKNEANGLRADLAQKLEALHPAFVRFPGGCIVQGHKMADAYRWKDTVGPVEQRKENENFWGYHMSYGIGFYEYFRFCEDLGATAVPVISCGISFDREMIGMADIDEFVQDADDLIEFANGDASTKWGKVRADMGHPAPFNMKYLEIGNENCLNDYYVRYQEFADELRDSHPEIKLIFGAGYAAAGTEFDSAWAYANMQRDSIDLVDEHYYMTPEWFLTNTHRYDKYDRNAAKVYIGEFASNTEGKRNNMYAALSEAAYMTSIERNGDVIELASYAPLFAKDGNTQWTPDMIWFNNSQIYETPDYKVQQMFMMNKADRTVPYTLQFAKGQVKPGFIGGTVGLGTWSTQAQYKNLKVTDNDTGKTVFDSNRANLGNFDMQSGNWTMDGSTIVQNSGDVNCRLVLANPGVNNYTYTLQAQKTGGMEGFLIMFGVNGKKLYWWNMGGWGNTQSCIEKGTADGRSIVSDSKPMNLATGQWYNIKIEVQGEVIKCYLDDQLMHTVTDIRSYDPLFAHVGEKDNGHILIKLVNMDDKAKQVQINLNGVTGLASEGTATILAGAKDAENSFKTPENVTTVTETVKGIAPSFTYNAKPDSVTILDLISK